MADDIVKLDSPEGMRILMEWARTHGYVLSLWHKELAEKHGVDTHGVIFSEILPGWDAEE